MNACLPATFPLGDPINGSPHSVCVHFPRIGDVIGYEEKNPEIVKAMRSGYPRFFENPLITELRTHIEASISTDQHAFLFATEAAARTFQKLANATTVIPTHGIFAVPHSHDPADSLKSARAFLTHTGLGLGSRQAEDILIQIGLRPQVFAESIFQGTAEAADIHIRSHLQKAYHASSIDDITLLRGGMHAFYTGFCAAHQIQAERGRDIWIQLGWLYVDTTRILQKCTQTTGHTLLNVFDLDALETLLETCGNRIAGIVTEIPTNPLIQTADLPRLHAIARKNGAMLVLDPTLVSPHNVHVLPYADLHINSLTKYACNEADVIAGALALNTESPFYDALKTAIPAHTASTPYPRDILRLAYQISNYANTVHAANESNPAVVDFLLSHPAVDKVWWAGHPQSAANFAAIQQKGGGHGSMISFSLKRQWPEFYDRMQCAKTPSFGAGFTMLCPFMYLAHYDLVSTPDGRKYLESINLPPELIRLSLGTEPTQTIINSLSTALRQ